MANHWIFLMDVVSTLVTLTGDLWIAFRQDGGDSKLMYLTRSLEISSCVRCDQNRYLKAKDHRFLPITKCFLCRNLTRSYTQHCHSTGTLGIDVFWVLLFSSVATFPVHQSKHWQNEHNGKGNCSKIHHVICQKCKTCISKEEQ